ncbi:hypothetical protein [Sulfuriflexus mobilis]|uniref:hypothetical protein n=1 Tax=Sulfuriflexus mobilis TaxID=1811807 RepID=UPI000F82C0A6|nr:hypothetical protein [Sulfuriflexus mobilis]
MNRKLSMGQMMVDAEAVLVYLQNRGLELKKIEIDRANAVLWIEKPPEDEFETYARVTHSRRGLGPVERYGATQVRDCFVQWKLES